MKDYIINKIFNKECYYWLKHVHYAKRIPSISHAYGLFHEQKMIGVITYGLPPAPMEQELWKPWFLLELNRLVVKEGLKKNVLSYFVSESLKKLPTPRVIISYADTDMGHHGYIYQATNWLYTGLGSIGVKSYVMKDGRTRHSRHEHLINHDDVVEIKKSSGKHRYFMFLGNHKEKKMMKKQLLERYKILDYPKGYNERYKTLKTVESQSTLL